MCLECLELFGVPLDPAHHAAVKRRPNRHAKRVQPLSASRAAPSESARAALLRTDPSPAVLRPARRAR
jgi:hypothetical protein